MRILKKFVRKLYHLIWFLSLFLIFLMPVHAMTDISNNNIHAIYYYEQDTSSNSDFQQNYSSYMTYSNLGLSNFSCSNGIRLYPYSHIEGTNIELSGLSFQNGDTIYLKITFTYLNSAYKVSNAYLSAFNDIISIYNRTNNGVQWSTKFFPSNVSSSIQVVSYHKTNVITTFSIPVTASGTGVRIAWGDNGSNKIFGFINDSATNVYFGITTASYQIIQDSNSVIIDQNQTIIDQNNTIIKEQKETNENLEDIEDTLTDDNVNGANSQVDDLLNNSNFNDSSGIQSIINAPLNFINSLSNTCSPINVTIPYIDEPLQIPCIKQELNNHIPLIVPILSTAINGFIVYRILLDLVRIIKNSRNPDDDRIEVLDL